MIKKRGIILLSLLLVFVIALTACGGAEKKKEEEPAKTEEAADEEKTEDEKADGPKKDSLVIALSGEPSTLDPHNISDNIAANLFSQIFDKLIRHRSDNTLEPALAESWEFEDDGKEMIFTLREGVKFHNGDPLTAEDVVYSLNRAIASSHSSEYTTMMDEAEEMEDGRVKLKLKFPYGAIDQAVAKIDIVNKKAVSEDEEGAGRNPMGTGAFKFVEWKSGDKFVLTANPDYYRGEPSIKDITYKIMVEAGTATIALEKGEIDVVIAPPVTDRHRIDESDKLVYDATEICGNTYVAFNNTEGLFTNEKLREAVSYAIDKEIVMIGSTDDYGRVIDNALPNVCFGYDENVTANPYDLERAKELMAEAGYPDGFDLTLKTMESPTYSKPTEILQDMLKEIGINATVDKMERGAYLDDVYVNAIYDMTVMSMIYEIQDGDCLYPFFHGSMIEDGQNFFRSNYEQLDKYLDDGRSSLDEDVRKEAYKNASQFINDEVVMIPLYTYFVSIAYDKDLKGIIANSSQRYEVFDMHWE